jgi:uncharacterized protein involved in exopolysaccharide biosynthesis
MSKDYPIPAGFLEREKRSHEEESLSVVGQLQAQMQTFFRHKILILVVTALGAAGGYYYLLQQEPVYRWRG